MSRADLIAAKKLEAARPTERLDPHHAVVAEESVSSGTTITARRRSKACRNSATIVSSGSTSFATRCPPGRHHYPGIADQSFRWDLLRDKAADDPMTPVWERIYRKHSHRGHKLWIVGGLASPAQGQRPVYVPPLCRRLCRTAIPTTPTGARRIRSAGVDPALIVSEGPYAEVVATGVFLYLIGRYNLKVDRVPIDTTAKESTAREHASARRRRPEAVGWGRALANRMYRRFTVGIVELDHPATSYSPLRISHSVPIFSDGRSG